MVAFRGYTIGTDGPDSPLVLDDAELGAFGFDRFVHMERDLYRSDVEPDVLAVCFRLVSTVCWRTAR